MVIFLLPVLLVSTTFALFTATGGTSFVIITLGAMEWQRRKGFRVGEGELSERENDHYYSTKMDKDSDHDLSMGFGRLASFLPRQFEPYTGKKYDFTKSEGHLLRSMLQPAIEALDQCEEVKEALKEDPGNAELIQIFPAMIDNLGKLVTPIIIYLEQFPRKRVKKIK